jgi:hypothetical protein
LGRPLTVYTPHDVRRILNSMGGLWLSDSHLLKYQDLLLEGSEITLQAAKTSTLPPFFLRVKENPNTHVWRY